MSTTTISHCVLTLLMKGNLPYKEIALEVRKVFPDCQTTHKSVASLSPVISGRRVFSPVSLPRNPLWKNPWMMVNCP